MWNIVETLRKTNSQSYLLKVVKHFSNANGTESQINGFARNFAFWNVLLSWLKIIAEEKEDLPADSKD